MRPILTYGSIVWWPRPSPQRYMAITNAFRTTLTVVMEIGHGHGKLSRLENSGILVEEMPRANHTNVEPKGHLKVDK